MIIYNSIARKIYSDVNFMASQERQTCHLKKLIEIEAYILDKTKVR